MCMARKKLCALLHDSQGELELAELFEFGFQLGVFGGRFQVAGRGWYRRYSLSFFF